MGVPAKSGEPGHGDGPRDTMGPSMGVEPEDVMEAVESVMATIEGDLSAVNLKLYVEIESLSSFINSAKTEIASLRPDDITEEHLPAATDELDAIVGATEQATNSIFEAVEAIEALTADMDAETADKITNAVTSVYEACGFQDITGQRITKVVAALKHIELKVGSILEAFGDQIDSQAKAPGPVQPNGSARPDEHLMNGPQLPTESVSQEDVDALLASFD